MTTVNPATLKAGTHTASDKDHKIVVPSFLAKYRLAQGAEFPASARLRLYLQALPGAGKTTFASSIPNSIHIDPEDSARFVVGAKASRFVPRDGTELAALLDDLIARGAPACAPITHVSIDTIEKAVELLADHLTVKHNANFKNPVEDIREFGKDGAGWGKINRVVVNYLQALYDAGFGWTVCGHLKEEVVDDPNSEKKLIQWRGLVNPGIRGGIYRDAQYVMRLRTMTATEKVVKESKALGKPLTSTQLVTKRVLELSTSPAGGTLTQMLKNRLGDNMPETIDVTGASGWDVFAAAYQGACASALETPA